MSKKKYVHQTAIKSNCHASKKAKNTHFSLLVKVSKYNHIMEFIKIVIVDFCYLVDYSTNDSQFE